MKKSTKRIVAMIIVVLVVLFVAQYLFSYYKAVDVEEYLKSSDTVTVENRDYGLFFDGEGTETLLIFYPGAKVEYTSYAPVLRMLCENGVDVALVKMPFNMAIFGISSADSVTEADNYSSVFVGGHSMGGAMAAKYAEITEKEIDGLIFFAAYTANDLKEKAIPVLSLYGEFDGVLTMSKVVEGRDLVDSAKYEEVCIEGGNHAYFGSYGEQKDDGTATITSQTQWDVTVAKVLSFIKSIA